MSDSGVSSSEMKKLTNMSDGELDAMRAGTAPADDADTARLGEFVRDLVEAFPEMPTAHLEESHVAAMLAASRLMTEKGESVSQPASKAHGPARQASGLPKSWKERVAMKTKRAFAPLWVKIAVAAAAILLAFSGVAVAGVLPAPVQKAVAATVSAAVGIDLPSGTEGIKADDSGSAVNEGTDQTSAADASDEQTQSVDANDQGDNEQSCNEQVGNEQGGQQKRADEGSASSGDHQSGENADGSNDGQSADSSDGSDSSGHQSDVGIGSGTDTQSSGDSQGND